mgnify:CR=1 FL=1
MTDHYDALETRMAGEREAGLFARPRSCQGEDLPELVPDQCDEALVVLVVGPQRMRHQRGTAEPVGAALGPVEGRGGEREHGERDPGPQRPAGGPALSRR